MPKTRQSMLESWDGPDSYPAVRPSSRLYRIRVEGSLDPSWSTHLGALRIFVVDDAEERTASVLEGALADQASLIGVLNALHDLNMTLLSVEAVDGGNTREADEAGRDQRRGAEG